MAIEKLLQDFPQVSTQAWEYAITRDLKGADYKKKLIWQTEEGLAVKPYYRSEDLRALQLSDAAPGAFPYIRSSCNSGNWRIREEIGILDPEKANQAARNAIIAGAEEIAFLDVRLKNASDMAVLLAGLQGIPVHFQTADEPLLRLLIEWLNWHKEMHSISTGWNPLLDAAFAEDALRSLPTAVAPFTIDGAKFEECGATAIEEISLVLAAGIDYLGEMQSRNVDIDHAARSIAFSFAIGSNYFFQIAKFRAFRMLWAKAVESFGGCLDSAGACIYARTSRWNKTIYDPYVNSLRATTEAMSAILGGVDAISVAPFDDCYKAPDEASRRLARNTQIILKHEALLARVADPGAGSYYLETITDALAREGWAGMQNIEQGGGYSKAVESGDLERALESSMAVRTKALVTRRRVLTGTNQFADPTEGALDRVEVSRLTAQRRGADCYEELRLRTERYTAATGKVPHVLLAEFGDAKMRSARSTFASNFLACAGFRICGQQFSNAEEIAGSNADMIVLCSSDAEYLAMATELMHKLSDRESKTPVIVAGNPESCGQLRAAGISDFIHIHSNPIEVLIAWQQQLGIKA